MAAHQIAADEIGAYGITLTANTEETFTFTAAPGSNTIDVGVLEIYSDGTAAAYVTIDGTTATIKGAKTYELPAVPNSIQLDPAGSTPPTVRVISAGTPTISVARSL